MASDGTYRASAVGASTDGAAFGVVSTTLYLLPSSLGEEDTASVLPATYKDMVSPLRFFFVEEVRTARRFLRKVGFSASFDEVIFVPINEHNRHRSLDEILKDEGYDVRQLPSQMGLLSEAGLPCVADPGNMVVEWAHAHGWKVKPVCGPSSLFLALMASGLNGQCFAFQGYLPAESAGRQKRIKELEALSQQHKQTQIFIETPYRNAKLWEAVVATCRPDTRFCVAKNICMPNEDIRTMRVAEWRKAGPPSFDKENAVFLMLSL